MMAPVSDGQPTSAIRVLLLEDDAPTRWRLHDALAAPATFEVTAAATLAEARAALGETGPQVLLTDLQLPDGHGVELIRETRQRFPQTEIMVISILGDEESVISAIMVGATGSILKDAFPTDIAATVRDLVAGHSPISASIARFIVRRTQGQSGRSGRFFQRLRSSRRAGPPCLPGPGRPLRNGAPVARMQSSSVLPSSASPNR